MGRNRHWLLRRFPWIRPRSIDQASQTSTPDQDPRVLDVLRQVISLRQAGDVQGSLALIDRSLADGMSSNYLLDNRARGLAQLNRETEAIQIWDALAECGDLELQEKSKRLVKLARQQQCRFVLQRSVHLSQRGQPHQALALLDVARGEGIENDVLLDHRARVLVQLNRHREAISIWQELTQSDPKKYNAILISQVVGALQLLCRSQGWSPQYFDQDVETLDALEGGVLRECDLLRGRGYAQLLIKLVDKAIESGFQSPWLVLAKANALIELEKFVDAKNLLNHFKESVLDRDVLVTIENMLDTFSSDVEVELVVQALVPLKAKGDLDAAQDLLVQALLQNHSCVLYEEKLQELLVERGEKNPELQVFELFLGEAERMRTAASISSQ